MPSLRTAEVPSDAEKNCDGQLSISRHGLQSARMLIAQAIVAQSGHGFRVEARESGHRMSEGSRQGQIVKDDLSRGESDTKPRGQGVERQARRFPGLRT